MALDMLYGTVGRLCRFNPAFLFFPPPFIIQYQPTLNFVPAVFLKVLPTGFPGFSRWIPLPVGSYGEYAECMPVSVYTCMDKPVFIALTSLSWPGLYA